MGWLKKVLNGVKKVAAPAIGFALGGPAGAAAAGALAGAIGNGKPKLSNIAGGAASGLAGGALLGGAGVVGSQGIGTAVNSAKELGLRKLGTNLVSGAVRSQIPGAGAQTSQSPGGGFGWQDAIGLGSAAMAGYGGYQAGRQQDAAMQRGNALQDRAIQFAEGDWADRAPMRKLGQSMMLDQAPEEVSGIYATSNPMARRYRKLGA